MDVISLKDVSFAYDDVKVMDHLDLDIEGGRITAVVGPSGCGKSTFLRVVAQLEGPDSGEIVYGGAGGDGSLRFLFQDYDAFPWYTTWGNVKRSAPRAKYPSDEDVEVMLRRVGLWGARERYPAELSGGMRKRLAIARCLISKPSVLLLDEPFSKLDVDTRCEMYDLVQELWQEFQQTIILITHDLHEAILLGSRIIVSTQRPFSIRTQIEVPFECPRTDAITTSQEYIDIARRLRTSLQRRKNEEQSPEQDS